MSHHVTAEWGIRKPHVVVREKSWSGPTGLVGLVCSDCFGSEMHPATNAVAHIRPCRSVSIQTQCLSGTCFALDPPCAPGEYEPHSGDS